MDISNILRQKIDESTKLKELEKTVKINVIKEKNRYKTQVFGMSDFISSEKIDTFAKNIQKKYGCSCINTSTMLVFSGNQSDNIKKMLVDDKIVTHDLIRI
jgi:translation initiation factor 1 (eIF-1/SUI1)